MRQNLPFILVLLFCGLSWGSSQVLGKISVSTGYRHLGLMFWQFTLGALILGAMLVLRGKGLVLTRDSLRFALVVALTGSVIPGLTFYHSVTYLPAGIMSILISSVPLISFPIALALGMDRLSALRLVGLMLGIAGVALIALPEASLPDPAMIAIIPIALIGPFFYAIEGNYVAGSTMGGMNAVQAMCLSSILGAVIVLPAALVTGFWINPLTAPWQAAEFALVGSAVIHAIAYVAYVWLALNAGAVFAAQTSYIVTGTGVIWAMVILGERFSIWVWTALVLMLAGLALVTPRPRVVVPAERAA